MKPSVIFVYCIIFVVYSCNTVSSSNSEKKVIQQENPNQVQVNVGYDKIVARLNALNLSKTGRDPAIIHLLSETNFQNQTIAPIQLTSKKCPFVPYMLVVYDHKLDLLNIKLDSIYTLDLKDKIQTASWSPLNKSEIFILTINEKKKPESEYALNLKLSCLNLNSMQFNYLTTFFDYYTPISRFYIDHYHPPTFFQDISSMEIDQSKKMICYQCFYPWDTISDDCFLPNLLTYSYEIKTKTTKLSKKLNIKASHYSGKKLEAAKEFFCSIDGAKFYANNDSVKIILSDKNNAEIKIPISIFNENDIKVTDLWWRFRAYFLKSQIVFSVLKEYAMDNYGGHVYLMDYNGKLLKKLGNDIGESFQLSELERNNYLLDPYDYQLHIGIPGLYLYDSAFNLLKQYKNVYYYELKQ